MNNSETKYYKAFDKNLKCRGMQYEIGKEYTFDGEPIPCRQGFHFCKSIADCYEFYDRSEDTRICEILPLGEVKTDGKTKYCTNKIKILEEIEHPRLKSNVSASSSGYCNSGDWNSGYCNSGNCNSGNRNSGNRNSGYCNSGNCNSGNRNSGYCNSGNCNSGNRNSGDWNSGDCNSGDCNSGYCNSGDRNSGDWNSGNCNSGNCNSGDRNSGDWNSGNCNSGNCNSGDWNSGYCNSGDWNSGNRNSGIFNTEKNPKIKIFDQESNWTFDNWYQSSAYRIMSNCPQTHSNFIYESDMTDKEKEKHPEYKTLGGYIKIIIIAQDDKQKWWDSLSDEEKQEIYSIPNFNAEKFEACTGMKVSK